MSNFQAQAIHPITGDVELADWLDNFNGRYKYGVRFPSDGKVFPASQVQRPSKPNVEEYLKR